MPSSFSFRFTLCVTSSVYLLILNEIYSGMYKELLSCNGDTFIIESSFWKNKISCKTLNFSMTSYDSLVAWLMQKGHMVLFEKNMRRRSHYRIMVRVEQCKVFLYDLFLIHSRKRHRLVFTITRIIYITYVHIHIRTSARIRTQKISYKLHETFFV